MKIPYTVFNDEWDLLQQFLERRGNPRYELVGDVNLSYRDDLFDLGNLVLVNGHLSLNETPIESLGNLEYVNGALDIYNTPLQSLENLKYVAETIYLSRNYQIPDEQLTRFKFKIFY